MKIKKCFLAIALTVAMIATMCVVATPVSAKTSYGVEYVRTSDAYIAVTPGRTYTIYARSTDGHGVKFFDVIPEGNCVKIVKQGRRKGTRNEYYCMVKASKGSSGDLIKAMSTKYVTSRSEFTPNGGILFNFGFKGAVAESIDSVPSSRAVTLGVGEKMYMDWRVAYGERIKYSSNNARVVAVNSDGRCIMKATGTARVTEMTSKGSKSVLFTVKKAPSRITITNNNGTTLTHKSIVLNRNSKFIVSSAVNGGAASRSRSYSIYVPSRKNGRTVWHRGGSKCVSVRQSGGKAYLTIKNVKGSFRISVNTYNGKSDWCQFNVR